MPELGSLQDFVASANRILVLGEGGLGKTTALLRLGAEAARRAGADPSSPIPVHVELKNFDASERGFGRLFEMAANAVTGMDEAEFGSLWRLGSRRFLFLLDGLNEQRGSTTACIAALRELTARAPHAYVVTSRPTAEARALTAAEEGFVVAEMLPLGQEDIRRFLTASGLAWLYDQMDDDLRGLTENPFMLVALARSCAGLPRAELPRNMGQLYRTFVDEYVFEGREQRRELVRYDYRELTKPVLAWLARRMTEEGRTVIDRDAVLERALNLRMAERLGEVERLGIRRRLAPAEWDAEAFVDEVIATGVVRSADDGVEFMHESVQEYFSAVALAGEPVEHVAALIPPLVWRHVDVDGSRAIGETDYPFRVPVLMLAGLLPEASRLVEALAGRNPLLAGRCVAASTSVDPAIVGALKREWLGLSSRAHERYRRVGASSLGAAGIADEDVIRRLIDLATDDTDSGVQAAARDALAELGLGRSADYLASKISYPSPYDAWTRMLVRLAPRVATRTMFEHWRRADGDRRSQLEQALAAVDRTVATDELRRLEQEAAAIGDDEVVAAAGDAAAGLPTWKPSAGLPIASQLVETMRKQQATATRDLARATDAELLEKLDPRANTYQRVAAATLLAERGRTDVLPRLLDCIAAESPRSIGARDLVRAAFRLGGHAVVDEFVARVWSSPRALYLRVPRQSGSADGAALPPAVAAALADDPTDLEHAEVIRDERGWTITWSSSFAGVSVPEGMLVEDAGETFDVYVVGTGMKFLDAIFIAADPERLLAELVHALEHPDAAVRALAAKRLGDNRDERGVAPLVALVARERDLSVAEEALRSLGRIASAAALETLLDVCLAGGADATLHAALEEAPPSEGLERLVLERARHEGGSTRAVLLRELASLRKRRTLVGDVRARAADDAREFLVDAALTEPLPQARRAAAEALRWSAGDPGAAMFVRELASADTTRRAAAAAALGALEEDGVAGELVSALADDDVSVRLAAATSLIELRAEAGADGVARVLADAALAGEGLLASDATPAEVRDRAFDATPAEVRDRAFDATPAEVRDRAFDAVVARLVEWIDGGREANAEEAITRLLAGPDDRYRGDRVFLWFRALARERQAKLTEALADLDEAAGQYGETSAFHDSRARVLAALERLDEAVATQTRAVELDPDNAAYYADLGWYRYLAGEFKESIRATRRSLELEPANATAAFNLALAHLASGDERAARGAHAVALDILRERPPDEREAILEAVRRDLDELRERRPELGAVIDAFEGDLHALRDEAPQPVRSERT